MERKYIYVIQCNFGNKFLVKTKKKKKTQKKKKKHKK